MQQRERTLLNTLLYTSVAALVLWGGGSFVDSLFFAPFRERREEISTLELQVDRGEDGEFDVKLARKKLEDWKARSLPPDPLDAQRLYQQWLTDLGQMAGFAELKINPGRRISSRKTFVVVQVALEGKATLGQIADFLFHFYRTDLLHRISEMTITSDKTEGDPLLTVSLTAEGLSLPTAIPRDSLDSDDESARIHPSMKDRDLADYAQLITNSPFVKPGPKIDYKPRLTPIPDQFVIRGTEMKLKAIVTRFDPTLGRPSFRLEGDLPEGMTINAKNGNMTWSPPEDHPLQQYKVTLHAEQSRGTSKIEPLNFTVTYRERNQSPTISTIEKLTAYLGRELSFDIPATDPDQPADRLTFSLAEDAPQGLAIDAASGRLTWKPSEALEKKDYQVTVTVTDSGIPPFSASQKITIAVDDDRAQQTYLEASVAVDDDRRGFLRDRQNDEQTIVKVGSTFKVADLEAAVIEIGRDYMLLRISEETWRLDLGKNLRSIEKITSENSGEANQSEGRSQSDGQGGSSSTGKISTS